MEPRAAVAPVVGRVVCASGLHANVRVHGDLDAEGAPVLADELEALMDSGVREITIDLEPMAFVDRVAHRVVADAATRLHALGGRLLLARSAS